jgi:hypothetical protein
VREKAVSEVKHAEDEDVNVMVESEEKVVEPHTEVEAGGGSAKGGDKESDMSEEGSGEEGGEERGEIGERQDEEREESGDGAKDEQAEEVMGEGALTEMGGVGGCGGEETEGEREREGGVWKG